MRRSGVLERKLEGRARSGAVMYRLAACCLLQLMEAGHAGRTGQRVPVPSAWAAGDARGGGSRGAQESRPLLVGVGLHEAAGCRVVGRWWGWRAAAVVDFLEKTWTCSFDSPFTIPRPVGLFGAIRPTDLQTLPVPSVPVAPGAPGGHVDNLRPEERPSGGHFAGSPRGAPSHRQLYRSRGPTVRSVFQLRFRVDLLPSSRGMVVIGESRAGSPPLEKVPTDFAQIRQEPHLRQLRPHNTQLLNPGTNVYNPRGNTGTASSGQGPGVSLNRLLARIREQRGKRGHPSECFWKYCV
ncbi:hypothetical protein QTO34_019108 [Cnephaeus nilssonii]|uniref:Urotensin-2 n=1 Tax=Cnephaeus nilssonii TaxID=3371016 RepID=A0AA40I038_CNENI|nr:hypothetical protein QTO34_019108 [Eptesicus nilssonii]